MASYKIPYKGVGESLNHLRKQVFDSIPYCVKNIPHFKNPQDLFYYLKTKTTYCNDPRGVELFQSAQTLLENNFHGTSGFGDCDCFTILSLASLIANGWYNIGIVLAGRTKGQASHIFAYVDTETGRHWFDLTNKHYDEKRFYPFEQILPFEISKNQIDMFLQLADKPKTRKTKTKKLSYNPYMYIPSKGLNVREDIYDDLTMKEFSDCMLSEGFSLHQISTLASRRTERKAERPRQQKKKERFETKQEGKRAKTERKSRRVEGKASKRESTGRARESRGQAKISKAENMNPDEETPLTKILDTTGNVIGRVVNGQVQPDDTEEQTDGQEEEIFDTENTDGQEEEMQDGLSGFYSNIVKKLFSKDSTSNSQPKPKKKVRKLTPEQKAKLTKGLTKINASIQQYGGGKPTVKVTPKPIAPIEKDTFTIFGKEVKKNYVYIGGTAILIGGAAAYKYSRK